MRHASIGVAHLIAFAIRGVADAGQEPGRMNCLQWNYDTESPSAHRGRRAEKAYGMRDISHGSFDGGASNALKLAIRAFPPVDAITSQELGARHLAAYGTELTPHGKQQEEGLK